MARRLLVLKIFAALLLFSGCAGVPRVAPRFDKPSTVPIRKAIAVIGQANAETKSHISKAQDIVRTIHLSLPEDKLKIDALTAELIAAADALARAEAARSEAEGARSMLDTQLDQQTKRANDLADSFDKQAIRQKALEESRHRWVKFFWISAALNVAAGIWIFRKPLLLAATGIGI